MVVHVHANPPKNSRMNGKFSSPSTSVIFLTQNNEVQIGRPNEKDEKIHTHAHILDSTLNTKGSGKIAKIATDDVRISQSEPAHGSTYNTQPGNVILYTLAQPLPRPAQQHLVSVRSPEEGGNCRMRTNFAGMRRGESGMRWKQRACSPATPIPPHILNTGVTRQSATGTSNNPPYPAFPPPARAQRGKKTTKPAKHKPVRARVIGDVVILDKTSNQTPSTFSTMCPPFAPLPKASRLWWR